MKKSFNYCIWLVLLGTCFNIPVSSGQMSNARNYINELYFGVPVSPEKFDIRRIFNRTENFYDYWESDTSKMASLSVKFEQNKLMTFLGNPNSLFIHFKPDGSFYNLAISSNYLRNEISKCEKQVAQILSLFDKISFKTNKNDTFNEKNILIGRGYSFYSSLKSYQRGRPYLQVSYIENSDGNYEMDLHYFPSFFY
ncbi:MAG TPA: hypothetical protein VIJ27_05870 [Mucilaginibacter sp.]